jgi:hypothetical protein
VIWPSIGFLSPTVAAGRGGVGHRFGPRFKIGWRFVGDRNAPQRVATGLNEEEQGFVTCWNQHNRWSEDMLINLFDTVGVTGSIPVSPTSQFVLVRRPFDD